MFFINYSMAYQPKNDKYNTLYKAKESYIDYFTTTKTSTPPLNVQFNIQFFHFKASILKL